MRTVTKFGPKTFKGKMPSMLWIREGRLPSKILSFPKDPPARASRRRKTTDDGRRRRLAPSKILMLSKSELLADGQGGLAAEWKSQARRQSVDIAFLHFATPSDSVAAHISSSHTRLIRGTSRPASRSGPAPPSAPLPSASGSSHEPSHVPRKWRC